MANSKDAPARRFLNSQQPINKLPPEILSWIFAAVVEEGRKTGDEWHYRDVFASRICSLWRGVVINDSTFWTHIHIASASHQQLALLHLNRSGSRLLSIELDLGTTYWDRLWISTGDHKSQVLHIRQMIDDFLGRYLHRWRSLRIYVACYKALVPFVSMINDNKAPELRFLSLEKETTEREADVMSFPESGDQPCALLGPSLPMLEELYYSKLPAEYLIGPSPTTFSCLTSLTLITRPNENSKLIPFYTYNANVNIHSLTPNTGATPVVPGVESVTSSRPLQLPCLHTLTLDPNGRVSWLRYAIQMIEAPLLYRLVIRCLPWDPHHTNGQGFGLGIMFSEVLGDPAPHTSERARFPALRELDISNYPCRSGLIGRTLRALPQITHICVSDKQAHLLIRSRLLPRLVCIRFSPHDISDSFCSKLENTVRYRAALGYPIQTVQVPKDLRSQVDMILSDTVEVQVWDDPHL